MQDTSAFVYVEAAPVGGYGTLYAYFEKQLRYPATALADSIQGTVIVTFVVNPAGQIENIDFADSLSQAFEEETRRLLEHMPPWTPATLNGKKRSARISLPLTFKIHDKH